MSGGPGTAMGISVTLVTTDQQAPSFFIHTVPASQSQLSAGAAEWLYVQADPAGTGLSPGEIIGSGTGPGTVDVAGGPLTPASCFGVAQHEIAAGSWGFILKSGIGQILAGTNPLTGGLAFVCGADAPAATDAAAVTDAYCGATVGTGIAASELGFARISL